jgi:hypothetical protein
MHLAAAIHQLESTGLRYTERQLYYAVCRAMLPAPVRALLPRLRWAPFTLPAPLSLARFERRLHAWITRNSSPPGLLPAPLPAPAAPQSREPDLDRYAMPRVLICQSAAIAAMLQANAATMEYGCAVLAAAAPLPAPIVAGLARAPAPRALLLHDASSAGLQLGAALAAHLPPHSVVRPIGLRPSHAARMHLVARRSAESGSKRPLPQDLTAAERRWLAGGWTTEVAAIPPFILLRVLRQAIAGLAPELTFRERFRRWPEAGFMSWP